MTNIPAIYFKISLLSKAVAKNKPYFPYEDKE